MCHSDSVREFTWDSVGICEAIAFSTSAKTWISRSRLIAFWPECAYDVVRDPSVTQRLEGIDLDALNRDLAQIVNAEKGAIFLATGPVPICGLPGFP